MSIKLKIIGFVACLTCITACTAEDDLHGFKDLDVKPFNQKIEIGQLKNEPWTKTPLLIVNELLPPVYNEEGNDTYKIDISKIANNSYQVIVTEEGLMDDSVYGEKTILTFIFQEGRWRISTIKIGFKCQESRGHSNYSGFLCS